MHLALRIKTYRLSPNFSVNIRILGEVFYKDTSYTKQAILKALNNLYKKRSILK